MDLNPTTNLDAIEPDDLDSGPIVVLNLLKFKTEESAQTYLEYASRVMKAFGEQGIEVLYAGSLKEKVQGRIGDWDIVLLARYPNRRTFYDMLRSDEYQSISPLREAALEDAVLWPSEPVLPYRTRSAEFDGGEWSRILQEMQW